MLARSVFFDRRLEDYTEHPRTVILSTHLIEQISRLLEHILFIDQGQLVPVIAIFTLASNALLRKATV